MNKKIETFSCSGIELFSKEAGKRGIRGYFAKYNVYSHLRFGFFTIIDPSFFDGLFSRTDVDIHATYTHDTNRMLARYCPSRNIETLKISSDSTGAEFELIPADTQLARDCMADIEHGNITGCSFGVLIDEDDWSGVKEGYPVRRLMKYAELDHICLTPRPMFEDTTAEKFSLLASKQEEEYYLSMAKKAAPNTMHLQGIKNKIRLMEIDRNISAR